MSDWIPLDPEKLVKPRQRLIRGVSVGVYPSPHDIPEAVRARYDDERDRFVIDFRFIGERRERLVQASQEENVHLHVGEHSRRLYRIEITGLRELAKSSFGDDDFKRQFATTVAAAIRRAFEALQSRAPEPSDQDKYSMAQEAFAEQSDELLGELAGA